MARRREITCMFPARCNWRARFSCLYELEQHLTCEKRTLPSFLIPVRISCELCGMRFVERHNRDSHRLLVCGGAKPHGEFYRSPFVMRLCLKC
jgi:hypothetical protein